MKYIDNFGNIYIKSARKPIISNEEIDRMVKMWDLHKVIKKNYNKIKFIISSLYPEYKYKNLF